MPENNEKIHNDLIVNRACTSTDLTTNVTQRMKALTTINEATPKFKKIIVDAGGGT